MKNMKAILYAVSMILVLSTCWAASNMQLLASHEAYSVSGEKYKYRVQTNLRWHWSPAFYLYRSRDGVSTNVDAEWANVSYVAYDVIEEYNDHLPSLKIEEGVQDHEVAEQWHGGIRINGAQMDGANLITFKDSDFSGESVSSTTILYYFSTDFDVSDIDYEDNQFYSKIHKVDGGDYLEISSPDDYDPDVGYGEFINTLRIPYQDVYKAGTIFDADILFDPDGDFEICPDEDDVSGDLSIYEGTPDIRMFLMREMGKALGLGDSLLESAVLTGTPFVVYNEDELPAEDDDPTDPYEYRNLTLDDEIALKISYSSVAQMRAGAYIAGNIMDGSVYVQPDSEDSMSDNVIMAAPVYLCRQAFAGETKDVFATTSSGNIKKVAQVYSGFENVFPYDLDASDDDLIQVIDYHYNGFYIFPGIPAYEEWRIYIDSDTNSEGSNNAYVEQFGSEESYEAEFYGIDENIYDKDVIQGFDQAAEGDEAGSEAGPFVSNYLLELFVNTNGQFSLGIPGAGSLLGNHPVPDMSFMSFRIGTTEVNNKGKRLGSVIEAQEYNDSTNSVTGTWSANNMIEVEQTFQIVGNTLYVDYVLKNDSDSRQTFDYRIVMDMTMGAARPADVIIEDSQLAYEQTIAAADFPDIIEFKDRGDQSIMRSYFDLREMKDSAKPSSIVIGNMTSLLGNVHGYVGASLLTGYSGMLLCFDDISLSSNGEKRIQLKFTNDPFYFEGWKDTPYLSYSSEAEENDVEISDEDACFKLDTTINAKQDNINIFSNDSTVVQYSDTEEIPPEFVPASSDPENGFYPESNSMAARFADLDNDGDLDAVLATGFIPQPGVSTQSAKNKILLQNADGRYIDSTDGFDINNYFDDRFRWASDEYPDFGVAYSPGNATSDVILRDFDNDGDIDIYFCNYGQGGTTDGARNRLLLNIDVDDESINENPDVDSFGDAYFLDVSHRNIDPADQTSKTILPGILNVGYLASEGDPTMKSDAADVDHDGDIDIVIANYGFIMGANAGTPYPISNRILINRLNDDMDNDGEPDGILYFDDDTYGLDNAPFGDSSPFSEKDRLASPVWIREGETDASVHLNRSCTTEIRLAQLNGDEQFDIFEVNDSEVFGDYNLSRFGDYRELYYSRYGNGSTYNVSGGVTNYTNNLYRNVDRDYTDWDYDANYILGTAPDSDGDNYADGYFINISFGFDFNRNANNDFLYVGIPDSFGPDYEFNGGVEDPILNGSHVVDNDQVPVESQPTSGMCIADFDLDSDNDIFIVNRGGANIWQLLINNEHANVNSSEVDEEANVYYTSFPKFTLDDRSLGTEFGDMQGVEFKNYNTVLPDAPDQTWFSSCEAIDYDGDGDYDIVLGNYGDYQYMDTSTIQYILRNDHSEINAPDGWSFTLIANPFGNQDFRAMDVNVGDYDMDGDPDIYYSAVGPYDDSFDKLFLNDFYNGRPDTSLETDAPIFINRSIDYLPFYYEQLLYSGILIPHPYEEDYLNLSNAAAFADFNSDGLTDIAIANGATNTAQGDYSVYYFNTGKQTQQGQTMFKVPSSLNPVPTVSLNANPDKSYNEPTRFFENDNDSAKCQRSYDIKAVDLDKDGDYDLVQSNNGGYNNLYINHDIDDTSYNTHPDTDFKGDAYFVDEAYVVLTDSVTNIDAFTGNRLPITIRDGMALEVQNLTNEVAIGDVNGDGVVDLVFATGAQYTPLTNLIYVNGRPNGVNSSVLVYGQFVDATYDPVYNMVPDAVESKKDNSNCAVILDMDTDGNPEIFFGGKLTGFGGLYEYTMRAWKIDANGKFQDVAASIFPAEVLADESSIMRIRVADFNGDGEPTEDINGNGVLDPGEDGLLGVGLKNGNIDYIDDNGNGRFDGAYDLYLVSAEGQNRLLFYDTVNNIYTLAPNQIDQAFDSRDAAVGDVDNDGDLDIVVSNYMTSIDDHMDTTVQVLVNDGNGQFTDVTRHEMLQHSPITGWVDRSNGINLVDIDNDGDLDMFVCTDKFSSQTMLEGGYNALFVNNIIGENENHPIVPPDPPVQGPTVNRVQPSVVAYKPNFDYQSETFQVRLIGENLSSTLVVDLGVDTEVLNLEYDVPDGNIITVTFRFTVQNPVAGNRAVYLIDPATGVQFPTNYSIFKVKQAETGVQKEIWEFLK